MTNFSNIPAPNIDTSEAKVPEKSKSEMRAIIDRMVKITDEGKKIRDEYAAKNLSRGTNCNW